MWFENATRPRRWLTAALFLLARLPRVSLSCRPLRRFGHGHCFAVGAAPQGGPWRFLDGLSSLLAMTVLKENAAGGR
jgi:hypothetical protein